MMYPFRVSRCSSHSWWDVKVNEGYLLVSSDFIMCSIYLVLGINCFRAEVLVFRRSGRV